MGMIAGGEEAQRLLLRVFVDRMIRSRWADAAPYHFSLSNGEGCECNSTTGSSGPDYRRRGRWKDRGVRRDRRGGFIILQQALSQRFFRPRGALESWQGDRSDASCTEYRVQESSVSLRRTPAVPGAVCTAGSAQSLKSGKTLILIKGCRQISFAFQQPEESHMNMHHS